MHWYQLRFCRALCISLHYIQRTDCCSLPIVIKHPTCPWQSLWIWCDPSMYQWTVKFISSVLRICFIYCVPFMYFSTLTSFPQLSLYGAITQIVRNDTTIWMSSISKKPWKISAIAAPMRCGPLGPLPNFLPAQTGICVDPLPWPRCGLLSLQLQQPMSHKMVGPSSGPSPKELNS